MLAAITIDQRSSRGAARSRVDEWAADLNERFRDELILPFATTVGDEIQGLTRTASTVVEILLGGVKDKAWWLGLGVGDVDTPLQQTAARSRGPAFYNAREAVDAAKKSHYGFSVQTEDPQITADVQTVLELLAFLIRRRGHDPVRWRAVELAREGASTVQVGRAFGITQQAASKRLRNAGFYEEMEGRKLAERLLREAMGHRNAR